MAEKIQDNVILENKDININEKNTQYRNKLTYRNLLIFNNKAKIIQREKD